MGGGIIRLHQKTINTHINTGNIQKSMCFHESVWEFLTLIIKVRVPFSFWGMTILCTENTKRASFETPGKRCEDMSEICLSPVNGALGSVAVLTWWQLEGDGETVVRSGSLRPLQFGVEGIQHIELHWLQEAVTLVLEDDRHHNFALILMVALDVVHLEKRKENMF